MARSCAESNFLKKRTFLNRIFAVVLIATLSGLMLMIAERPSSAADHVEAVVDRTTISLGESLQLSVTIKGENGAVDVGGIDAFKVISSGSSTNFEFINGRSSHKTIYNYVLLPTRTGRLTIPALPVTINGKTLYTKPIDIQVQKSATVARDSKDIFLKVRVSDQTPYLGQQISCTFTLYHAVEISEAQFQKPDFKGFSAEELKDQNTRQTVINGREYVLRELTYILIPQKTGPLTIEPAQLRCDILHRSRPGQMLSPFDDFFGRTQVETRVLQSEPLSLTVNPLPPVPPSTNFSGLVGRFKLGAKIDRKVFSVGDSVTLTLTLEGNGNLMDAPNLWPLAPAAFKQYHDSPSDEIRLTPDGYEGKKQFKTALVPVKAGDFILPKVTLTYFDIQKKAYQTLATDPLALNVKPAKTTSEQTSQIKSESPGNTKSEVIFTGRDILPLKEDLDALQNRTMLSLNRFLVWIFLPAIGYWVLRLTFGVLGKQDDQQRKMVRKSRNLLDTAAKTDPFEKEYLSLLYGALVAAIRSKSGTIGESLTWSEAESLLGQSDCDQETIHQATRLLTTIETENYGGGQLSSQERRELLAMTQAIARKLLK
jgi:hypothetical protein